MPKKGQKSYVSRSVYQKVCEENKRLKRDIHELVMNAISGEAVLIRLKWRKQFMEEKELRDLLHAHAVEYINTHPDDPAVQFVKSLNKDK